MDADCYAEETHNIEDIEDIYVGTDMSNRYNKTNSISKLQSLMKKVFNSKCPISNIQISTEGDITYSVSFSDLGFDYEQILFYKSQISCQFFVDFIGEYFVRENIEKFIFSIEGMDDYYRIANKYRHRCFGIKIEDNCFKFIFHVSLLQNILTEDFRKIK